MRRVCRTAGRIRRWVPFGLGTGKESGARSAMTAKAATMTWLGEPATAQRGPDHEFGIRRTVEDMVETCYVQRVVEVTISANEQAAQLGTWALGRPAQPPASTGAASTAQVLVEPYIGIGVRINSSRIPASLPAAGPRCGRRGLAHGHVIVGSLKESKNGLRS